MKDTILDPPAETEEEKDLNAAIDRVYRRYGTDLPAFFRDVYEEMALKRQESSSNQNNDILR